MISQIVDENGDITFYDGFRVYKTIHECVTHFSEMISPVKCNHCGKIYDLTTVKVNRRYKDCDQFTTPCCGYEFADNRTWKSFPDYKEFKPM